MLVSMKNIYAKKKMHKMPMQEIIKHDIGYIQNERIYKTWQGLSLRIIKAQGNRLGDHRSSNYYTWVI